MSASENREATKRVFEALEQGNMDAATRVLGGDLKTKGREAAAAAKKALPDVRIQLEDMIAEGDKVVARWTARGTHKGAGKHQLFGSVKATGKGLNVEGITILRFEGGQVVETWGVTDELQGARQLGLVRKRPG